MTAKESGLFILNEKNRVKEKDSGKLILIF